MKLISNLIDAGTLTKKIIVQSLDRKKESGWLCCIIAGEVKELFMYYTEQGERFISHQGEQFRIDTTLKPITANYQHSDLIGYY